MKYYLVTAQGETGPLSTEKLNRMFQNGEIRGEQLCRPENSLEKRRLDVMFKHFAPSQTIAAKARQDVAAYNLSDGMNNIALGSAMVLFAIFSGLVIGGLYGWKIGAFIVGAGLIAQGRAQQRRGLEAQAKMRTQSHSAPTAVPTETSALSGDTKPNRVSEYEY